MKIIQIMAVEDSRTERGSILLGLSDNGELYRWVQKKDSSKFIGWKKLKDDSNDKKRTIK